MQIELLMSKEFENIITQLVLLSTNKDISQQQPSINFNEWMSLNDAAKYAGVSHNTFMKFRVMGLRVSEIDSVKRVSRKEIDQFLESHSF